LKEIFNSVVACVGVLLTFLFGSADTAIKVLLVFMFIDFITGWMKGKFTSNLNSERGYKGICKKITILMALIVAVMLDKLLGYDFLFRTTVCYFYIANEGLSIVENIGLMGVPLPPTIKGALAQLQIKEKEAI
jgi:toxin secretion/phage lysis holin